MKLLNNKILSNKFFLLIRNTLKIKPVRISKYYLDKNISMSDAFLFRTDNNYESLLRFNDIPKFFFDYKNTEVEIEFYDNKNNFIKKINLNPHNINNQLLIDKNFLDGREIYGHFYIFHKMDNYKNEQVSFSNRCYVGYANLDKNFSFVHGNTYVKAKDLKDGSIYSDFCNRSLIVNYRYLVQENFSNIDYVELFLCNPTSYDLKLRINSENYLLKGMCDQIYKFKNIDTIKITSNCTNLRPIVFTHKDKFYDVHHG